MIYDMRSWFFTNQINFCDHQPVFFCFSRYGMITHDDVFGCYVHQQIGIKWCPNDIRMAMANFRRRQPMKSCWKEPPDQRNPWEPCTEWIVFYVPRKIWGICIGPIGFFMVYEFHWIPFFCFSLTDAQQVPGACFNFYLCNISDEDYGSIYDALDDHQILIPGPEVDLPWSPDDPHSEVPVLKSIKWSL